MTCSGDIYSFGILILEVMTGKKPTDDIFNEDLSLHKFGYMALQDCATNVNDRDLLNVLQEDMIARRITLENAKKIKDCMTSILKVGVSCSVDSPPQRMNTEDVISELQNILNTLQSIKVPYFVILITM